MNDPAVLRILDANANRAREAIRVLEDYARFALNDVGLAGELKGLRHGLAEALALLPMEQALLTRDTVHDVGTTIKTPAELVRASMGHVVRANAKRLSEALRSLEECAKTLDAAAGQLLEKLRYRGYTLEQTLGRMAGTISLQERFRQVRLYVLLTEKLCHKSGGGWEKTLDEVLSAGGASLAVQLREKEVGDGELLRRTRLVVQKCRQAGALAIINDRADIALLAGADGVHVGQTDLPCEELRKEVGSEFIIGVSTENVVQAEAARRAGATYIAAGPMFSTTTKEKPRLAGPAYAQEALRVVGLPVVAIGGITPENVGELTAVGVRSVAVCAGVIAQTNPGAIVGAFLERLG